VNVPTELVGCEVWRTAFDYQVRLTLVARASDEGYRVEAELVIETPFLLRDAAGVWHEVDPGSVDTLHPVLRLFMSKVAAVTVTEHGALTIDFVDGHGLFVSPDTAFESWRLSGTGVHAIVVGPGGEPSQRS
jgi:hypothetical protein